MALVNGKPSVRLHSRVIHNALCILYRQCRLSFIQVNTWFEELIPNLNNLSFPAILPRPILV